MLRKVIVATISAGLDHRSEYFDRTLGIDAKPLEPRGGAHNGRRRAIGYGRAHRQRERIGDGRSGQHFFERVGNPVLR